jgi:hypothetical protein
LSPIDMLSHNKSGIAFQDKRDGQRPLLLEKGENPTSSRGCQ